MDEEEVSGRDPERAAFEAEALQLGWVPQEKYKGPPERWKDAPEFVIRGREILGIARANNEKLMGDLAVTRQELAALKGTLSQQSQTVKDLLDHQASEIKRQVESRIAELRSDKKAALREGDHERAADLEEAIDKIRDDLAAANAKAVATPAPPPVATFNGKTIPPDVEPWAAAFAEKESGWFGKDKIKTGLFAGIAEDLYEKTSLRGTALLEEAKKQMEDRLTPATRVAKSEGGTGGWEGTGGASGSKSFASLPPEAKEMCKAQAGRFVGPKGSGKAFDTAAAWQKHYAETFFASQSR